MGMRYQKYMESFNDWFSQHRDQSDGRYFTFKKALDILFKNRGRIIVETGTQRQEDDWGAGMSTTIFGKYCSFTGSRLYTVDNDPRNLFTSKALTEEFKDYIKYILSDSIKFLSDFNGKIDLLYLDSFDYPYGVITDYYGGKDNLDLAIQKSNEVTEEEILERFGENLAPCQEHQLNELKMAYDKLSDNAIILLDDAHLPAQGKVRLSRKFLQEEGWEEVLAYQQVLFTR